MCNHYWITGSLNCIKLKLVKGLATLISHLENIVHLMHLRKQYTKHLLSQFLYPLITSSCHACTTVTQIIRIIGGISLSH